MKLKHLAAALLLSAFFGILSAGGAFAAQRPVSSTELIENAAKFDGTSIVFEGEAVGDILYRGDNAWVNLMDANNSAMGVFLPAATAKKISFLGRYGVRGDTLRVSGIFHRACAEHGGDMDIHADNMQITEQGKRTPPTFPTSYPWLAVGAALTAAVLCTLAVRRLKLYNTSQRK